jgi:quinol monooxygenase YgiN
MEATIKQKQEALDLCQKIIPKMTAEEIGLVGFALNRTVERLVKEGMVKEC